MNKVLNLDHVQYSVYSLVEQGLNIGTLPNVPGWKSLGKSSAREFSSATGFNTIEKRQKMGK